MTKKTPVLSEHFRTVDELTFREKLVTFLTENLPTRTRLMLNDEVISHPDVRLVCNGSYPEIGYYCYLEPGHKGKCYTRNKHVDFIPKNR